MANTTSVFGIYDTSRQAASAVAELEHGGFAAESITVLHNEQSRDFATRENTHLPAIAHDRHGDDVPLGGSWGLLDPQCGPNAEVLSGALNEMGISKDCAEEHVLEGDFLLSVNCADEQSVRLATEILIGTGGAETGVGTARFATSGT